MSSMFPSDPMGAPPGGPMPPMGGGMPPLPPPPPEPEIEDEMGGDPTSLLRQIQKMIQQYIGMETTDDIETSEATKISDLVQKLLATEQKESEAAMGTTPALKAMARSARRGL